MLMSVHICVCIIGHTSPLSNQVIYSAIVIFLLFRPYLALHEWLQKGEAVKYMILSKERPDLFSLLL